MGFKFYLAIWNLWSSFKSKGRHRSKENNQFVHTTPLKKHTKTTKLEYKNNSRTNSENWPKRKCKYEHNRNRQPIILLFFFCDPKCKHNERITTQIPCKNWNEEAWDQNCYKNIDFSNLNALFLTQKKYAHEPHESPLWLLVL